MKFLSLDQACQALSRGELLVFPTETFFGLGCDALNPDAVGAIFAVKQRSMGLPLPVIIGAEDQLEIIARDIPCMARELMQHFWPGPLSLVFPAQPSVPDLLIANSGRVAVRCSSHPAAQALCRESGMILVASSANISGEPPALTLDQLDARIERKVAGIYSQDPKPYGGLPSTIAAVLPSKTGEQVCILRPGAVPVEDIKQKGFPVIIQSTF